MHKTVVIDIVGLSTSVMGDKMPFLKQYCATRHMQTVEPMLPAVTTAVQSTYLTGKWPSETGIVGNGWYDKSECEIKFWKQSNSLVQAEKIWERAKKEDPNFTCAQMFWWYNMYAAADYSVTPRPNYLADGRKIPDCYSYPASLRDELQEKLGQFPLFNFWGPGANIKSTKWIADASIYTDQRYDPTLTLIYLPHLDYCLQKFGPDKEMIREELVALDGVLKDLITYYEEKKARVILLSEYGIMPVTEAIHINRLLRNKSWIGIREERGLELLDAGASKVFAVADHQVAHVYVNDKSLLPQVKSYLQEIPGIARILDREEQKKFHIDHERAGDLVLVAQGDRWFSYYFWLDDSKAPDYARSVDIHKKPGYDPVEMFMTSKLRAGWKLLRKKVGLRYVMDVIPLDTSLIKGSHGSVDIEDKYKPVLITANPPNKAVLKGTDVYGEIWETLTE